MYKEIQLSDVDIDGFLHSRITNFTYDHNNKIFIAYFNYINLKIKGSFYSCVMAVTDWWNLEVYEYNKQQCVKQFSLHEIPELDRIIDVSFENDVLILTDFGMHNNTAIDYKFTKPKIKITGEYDPD